MEEQYLDDSQVDRLLNCEMNTTEQMLGNILISSEINQPAWFVARHDTVHDYQTRSFQLITS